MSLVGLSERGGFYAKAQSGALGPGSYDTKLPQDIKTIKKRSRSDRPLAFGSGAVKQLNTLGSNQYSPGPGFYNQIKHKSSFSKEFMKSDQDKNSYYLIQNGTLLRKLQQFSANQTLEQRPDISGLPATVPGPGKYSPRQYSLTADVDNKKIDARKYLTANVSPDQQTQPDTMRSFTQSNNDFFSMTKTTTLRELMQSKGDLGPKRTIGNNPPPKLPFKRPKAVPSIPSNTVAPPEDKTKTLSKFEPGATAMRETEKQTDGFNKQGPRVADYMAAVEKVNNPNVGPGSYDPIVKPKLTNTVNTDWSRQPERFKDQKSEQSDSAFIQHQQYPSPKHQRRRTKQMSTNYHYKRESYPGSKQTLSNQASTAYPDQANHQNSQYVQALNHQVSAGQESFNEKFLQQQDPAYVAALQAQVRVSTKQISDQPPLGLSRSLSVSQTEGATIAAPVKPEDDPNFERDLGAIAEGQPGQVAAGSQASQTSINNQNQNYSPKHGSPRAQALSARQDSIEKSLSSPRVYKQSPARINAQEKLEKSLKMQKEEAQAMQQAIKEGSMPKQQIETIGMMPTDPSQIDTKANLKEQFSRLTQKRQPRPGPGSYSIPSTFTNKTKLPQHQFFGSTNARFQGSIYHKGVGSGIAELGPGKYEKMEDIQTKEDSKKQGFIKNQEIIAFHKLRQLFPEKTSISTVQLNKIKPYEAEHLGPGSYAKATEAQKKAFGGPMAAAFGSTDNRKLDNTSPGVLKNPGPGTYEHKDKTAEHSLDRIPQAVFRSTNKRKENLSGDPSMPSPTAYNLADFNSIARKPLQGGAPNNVLSLQKAENKKLIDQMFPFLVKGRMESDSRTNEFANLGPDSYSPSNANLNTQSSQALKLKQNLSIGGKHNTSSYLDASMNKIVEVNAAKNTCFGSQQGRFDEQERLLNKAPSKMGPGAYSKVNFESKGKNFSTRFNNPSGLI